MKQFVLGIDVGGTNIKFGLVDQKGKIVDRSHLSTKECISHKEKLIDKLVRGCEEIIAKNKLSKENLRGIGIGLPGLINAKEGIVYSLTNIPGWKNVPLKRIIEKKLRVSVFIDNDVNVITLGEWKKGAGKGKENMICITLGTGVGGGLVIKNKMYRGEGFAAGEIGHIPVQQAGRKCNCGGNGCLETLVGNRYLLQKAKRIFKKRDFSLEDVSKLACQGNRKAVQFWQQVGEQIGIGLTGVVNVLNPSCIVVGGGVANAYAHISGPMLETIQKRAMRVQGKMVKIKKSNLGPNAGIIGAQALVEEEIKFRAK
ncbi:MAG: ROK family protein [Candidatus Aceula meridiana]|nr:ROK family protein [Candidatus Aceula meridiana]